MQSDRHKFVIPDARRHALKSDKLLNFGDTFASKAAALRSMSDQSLDQSSDQKTQTISQLSDTKESTSSTESIVPPATTPTSSIKSKLASLTSARRKPADEELKLEEKLVSAKQEFVLGYHDVKKINERLDIYIEYLRATKNKANPNDRSAIQQKIDIALSLKILKGGAVDFNKFTDAYGFSATAKLITKHRNESIFNKYIQSQGSILVADIEALLPPCYEAELKIRRMRELLEKYQAHLDAAFFSSQALENKKRVIAGLLDLLNLKVDSDPNEALELFNAKWRTSISEIVRHRNKFFEKASIKSEGQELKENIEDIFRTKLVYASQLV